MASHVAGKLRATISNVVVEYTAPDGTRQREQFPTQAQAKRFYREQSKAGREPKVVSAETR